MPTKVDILKLVGLDVQLIQGTSGFWNARCPFHDDNRPSMWINPDRGMWGCHACGAKGDAYNYLMLKHNIGFTEALKMIQSGEYQVEFQRTPLTPAEQRWLSVAVQIDSDYLKLRNIFGYYTGEVASNLNKDILREQIKLLLLELECQFNAISKLDRPDYLHDVTDFTSMTKEGVTILSASRAYQDLLLDLYSRRINETRSLSPEEDLMAKTMAML